MLVKILKSFSTLNFSAQQGEKLEIEGDILRDLLEAGYVASAKPETTKEKKPKKGVKK